MNTRKLIFIFLIALQFYCIFSLHISMKRKTPPKPFLDLMRLQKGLPPNMRVLQKSNPFRKFKNLREQVPFPGNFTTNAIYYIQIGVGSPAQPFTVQVDTGSADLAIPQTGCKCGTHINPYFDPSKSKGANPVSCSNTQLVGCKCTTTKQCEYKIEYGDGSGFTASIYNDTLSVGSLTASGLFGGITVEVTPNGPFEPYKVDGICGFGQKKLSVVEATPFPMTFSDAGQMRPIFSMCADSDFNGGVLSLGEIGVYQGNISYTPILTDDFYSVYVEDFLVDGESVGVEPSVYNEVPAIVDSGTNAIYWPNRPYNVWENRMIKDCGKVHYVGVCGVAKKHNIFAGYCFSMDKSELALWPNVTIVLGKSTNERVYLTLTPQQYITQGSCDDETQYALDFINGPASDGIIIGENIMLGRQIVYDYGNKRMGFATATNCPSSI